MNERSNKGQGGDEPMRERQAHRLGAWLREWEIDRALRGSPGGRQEQAGDAGGWPAGVPTVGEVRLLHPALIPSADRPVFVAMLEALPAGEILVAPFSRFAEPATDGEWATGRRAKTLRVLCLWNARRVPAARLRRSWPAGRLSRVELDRAWRLQRSLREGARPPSDCRGEIGVRIVHPHDPRRVYVVEEEDLMNEWSAGACAPDGTPASGRDRLSYTDPEGPALQRAAECGIPYGTSGGRGREV